MLKRDGAFHLHLMMVVWPSQRAAAFARVRLVREREQTQILLEVAEEVAHPQLRWQG
jgi:hypothetical protein